MNTAAMLDDRLRSWTEKQLGSPLTAVQQLKGSTSTSLFLMQTHTERCVLRVFDNAEWLAIEPDLVPHEAAALRHAAGHTIRTPELIAAEADASVCGVPVLLMSFLPGAVWIVPDDLQTWLHQLAQTLFDLHQIPAEGFGWAYRRWYRVDELHTPRWTKQPALWDKLRRILSEPLPTYTPRFIHRDYHPVNLLFERGQISGVVDWINACTGAVGVDLAHCRNNLVGLYGVEAAESFLAAYQKLAGGADPDQPYWDLNGFVESFYGDDAGVYEPWRTFGMNHLTDTLVHERLDAYLAHILRTFGES